MSCIAEAVDWAAFIISWLDWTTASPTCTTCPVAARTLLNTRSDCSTLVVNSLTNPARFFTSPLIKYTTAWTLCVRFCKEPKLSFVWFAKVLTCSAIVPNSRANPRNCLGSFCSAARADNKVALIAKVCVREAIWVCSWAKESARLTKSPKASMCWTIRSVPCCKTPIPWFIESISVCPCSTKECIWSNDWFACLTWRAELLAWVSTYWVKFSTWAASCAWAWALLATVFANSSKDVAPCDTFWAALNTWASVWPSSSIKRLRVSATNPVARSLTCASTVKSPASTADTISRMWLTSVCNTSFSCLVACSCCDSWFVRSLTSSTLASRSWLSFSKDCW